MTLVLASNNQNKLREYRQMLAGTEITLLSQREAGQTPEVEETGETFEANALLKAEAAAAALGLPALADDSGLAVAALDGAPGVRSARFGGCASDGERNALLLRKLAHAGDRRARFVCCICCVFPDGRRIEARGECGGLILRAGRGENGFGYDPIFYLPEYGRSMAELTDTEKNGISHRGKALRAFRSALDARMREDILC